MTVSVSMPKGFSAFLDALKPGGRRNLYSAAANAVRILVRGHLAREATVRHSSAERLAATPTGHLEKAARGTVSHADEFGGEVIIPGAGINRAFHDVVITPKNANALTLPTDSLAYGRRVAEVKALGWTLFRPKGKDFILGSKDTKKGYDDVRCLYVLKKRVQQRQDRSLLPSDAELSSTASRAVMSYLQLVSRKAS